jgi:hypothetical protein
MKKISILILSSSVLFLSCTNQTSNNFGAYTQAVKQESTSQPAGATLPKEQTQAEKPTVGGTVFYPDGKPAPEAQIYAYPDGESPFSNRIPSTSSDKSGKFALQLATGKYQFCAWKQSENYLLPNLLPFGLPVGGKCEDVSVTTDGAGQISLTLAPKSNSLTGKINDWGSVFLPEESKVVLYRPLKLEKNQWVLTSSEEATWDARTEVKPDENGNFTINGLPEGTYFLRIELPDKQVWHLKEKTSGKPVPVQIKNGGENKISFSYF